MSSQVGNFDDTADGQIKRLIRSLPLPNYTERKCKCSLRGKLVGDGCEVCNPKLAEDIRKEPTL